MFAFIAFNNAPNNKKDNLTLLHMGEIFAVDFAKSTFLCFIIMINFDFYVVAMVH